MIRSLLLGQAEDKLPEDLPLIGRQESLQHILSSVRAGNCVRVLGPRYRDKRPLLQHVVAQLQQDRTHYASYQSLRKLPISSDNFFSSLYRDVPLVNEGEFFTGLYTAVVESLSRPTPSRKLRTAFAFQTEILQLLRQLHHNLVIIIDDLEVAPPNLVASLLGVLQSVYMTVVDQPGARFQAVVCGSLSFSQLTLASASHFEGISDLVLIPDFDEAACDLLVGLLCKQAGREYVPAIVSYLYSQTGGDQHLITQLLSICFEQMGQNTQRPITPPRLEEAINVYLAQEPDMVVLETIEQIQSDPNLLSCALDILQNGRVPSAHLPIPSNETPNPLDLCGAFVQDGDTYAVKCEIWERLLRHHLAPAQIGGWYAVAGYWEKAIAYLGKAVRSGKTAVRAELFAVVINAIHVSKESAQAYQYLADGLQAAYPNTTLRLYQRTDQLLRLRYNSKPVTPELETIPLKDVHRQEIVALYGPDYSLASYGSEIYLLIPLRAGSARSHPMGLVALGGLFTETSPYQQRKDVLRFIGFLRQAARAILRAALLEEDERRRQQLENVANITPKVSARLDVNGVYDAVLEQLRLYLPQTDAAFVAEIHAESQSLKILRALLAREPMADAPVYELAFIDCNGRFAVWDELLHQKQPQLIPDVTQRTDCMPIIANTRAMLCVPIKTGDLVHNALILESSQVDAFGLSDQKMLELVVRHMTIAIQNARQFKDASARQLREQTATMATGLVHDIYSAVASIPDLVDELSSKLARGKDVADPLRNLSKSAELTGKVSKRLRDVVVTGQQKARQVDLESLIKTAVDISERSRPPYVAEPIINMNGLSLMLHVDDLWIELLLKNLLVNAYESIDHQANGIVTIDVEIDAENIYIQVKDNGNGIETSQLNAIFDLGYSTKDTQQSHMHGIGLYHSRLIAQSHQGDLSVLFSEINVGTTFVLQLPRTQQMNLTDA